MQQEMMRYLNGTGNDQTICKKICTLLHRDNHANTSLVNYSGPLALPDAQPTVSGTELKDLEEKNSFSCYWTL